MVSSLVANTLASNIDGVCGGADRIPRPTPSFVRILYSEQFLATRITIVLTFISQVWVKVVGLKRPVLSD